MIIRSPAVNQSELPDKLELEIVDKTKLILTAFHYNNNNDDDDECGFVKANYCITNSKHNLMTSVLLCMYFD